MLLGEYGEVVSMLEAAITSHLGATSCVHLNIASAYLHQKNLNKV